MKQLLLFVTLFLFFQSSIQARRCTGSANCTACTNCSRCKYCSNGGSCGVCAGTSSGSQRSYSTPRRSKKHYREDNSNSIYSYQDETSPSHRKSKKNKKQKSYTPNGEENTQNDNKEEDNTNVQQNPSSEDSCSCGWKYAFWFLVFILLFSKFSSKQ